MRMTKCPAQHYATPSKKWMRANGNTGCRYVETYRHFYMHIKLLFILKRRINANLHEFYQLSRWIELDKNYYMVNSWAIT